MAFLSKSRYLHQISKLRGHSKAYAKILIPMIFKERRLILLRTGTWAWDLSGDWHAVTSGAVYKPRVPFIGGTEEAECARRV